MPRGGLFPALAGMSKYVLSKKDQKFNQAFHAKQAGYPPGTKKLSGPKAVKKKAK